MVADSKSTFEDLEVWKEAHTLRQELTRLARGLPSEEKFRLGDQIIRAARSVTANSVHPVEYVRCVLFHGVNPMEC